MVNINIGRKISKAAKIRLSKLTKKEKQKKWPMLKGLNGETNGRWKGGIHYRSDGYVLINIGPMPRKKKGARYKLLHRIVMEKHLGRTLLRSEIVHHKNENKSDNRIKNLEVITQAEHAAKHYKGRKKNNKSQFQ